MSMTEAGIFSASKLINCSIAAIKAVAEVESKGSGFLADGNPMILFEPHIFHRELTARKAIPKDFTITEIIKDKNGKDTGMRKVYPNPIYADLIYPKWKSGAYGKYSEQHGKLQRAITIDREAALSSASWGKFQIMGFNWKACKCDSLQDFINAMYRSEDDHLRLFINFCITNKLDGYLRARDWAKFANGYNGSGYKVNKYDTKLEAAYNKYK